MVGLPYIYIYIYIYLSIYPWLEGKCAVFCGLTSRLDPNDPTTRAAHGNHRHPKRFRFILFDLRLRETNL